MPNIFSRPTTYSSLPEEIWMKILKHVRQGLERDPLDFHVELYYPPSSAGDFDRHVLSARDDFINISGVNGFFERLVQLSDYSFPHHSFIEKADWIAPTNLDTSVRRMTFTHRTLDISKAQAIVELCASARRLQFLQIYVQLANGTASVTRGILENGITNIFDECKQLKTVLWYARDVPVLRICRELGCSQLRQFSIAIGRTDPPLTLCNDVSPRTWTNLEKLHVATFSTSYPREKIFVFATLAADSFPNLRELWYTTGHWETEVEVFLTRCPALQVLVLACGEVPEHVNLPDLLHLQVVAVRTKIMFHILNICLPSLHTIALLDYPNLLALDPATRYRSLLQLSISLLHVNDSNASLTLKRIVVVYTSAQGLASLPWDEGLPALTNIRDVVSDFGKKGVEICDTDNTKILYPFVNNAST